MRIGNILPDNSDNIDKFTKYVDIGTNLAYKYYKRLTKMLKGDVG